MQRIVWMASLLAAVATTAGASDAASLMTQGKLAADMGHHAEAATAFEAVADDATAPARVRAEALVRLGLVRRDGGDEIAAYRAFARVWRGYREEPEAVALLVRALGGALPSAERWNEIWQKVEVEIDTGKAIARIEWPGVPASVSSDTAKAPETREAGRASQSNTIELDFKEGHLQDVFLLFADITGLNVVVHPGTQGQVTFQCKDVPWEEALGRILAPNGLWYDLNGPVLEIGAPGRLPRPREFRGQAGDFEFRSVDLVDTLRQIADRGGRRLSTVPGLAGKVTLKLVGVPWDQAFDLVVRLNGLDWSDDGATIQVRHRGRARTSP